MMVNDVHCHFLSTRFFATLGAERRDTALSADDVARELGWEAPHDDATLADRWATELDRHDVRRAALIASVPGDEESVAVALRRHHDRFVGFFAMNPAAPGALDRARHAFTTLRMRCACLFAAMHHYELDSPAVVRLFELAHEHHAAIFAHCGYLSIEARGRMGLASPLDLRCGNPLTLAKTAAQFPGVPVIIPHFGAGLFREALMAADAAPNIVLDTSSSNGWIKYVPGLTLADVFRQALSVVGPERLIFGTDSSSFPRGWRRVIMGSQRAMLDELGVEAAAQDKIFHGNFERLFPLHTRV